MDGSSILGLDEAVTDGTQTQTIALNGFVAGQTYNLTFNNSTISSTTITPLTFSATQAVNAANIQAALLTLPSIVLDGGTVTVVPTASPTRYNVTFGGTMVGTAWPSITGAIVGAGNGTITTVAQQMSTGAFGVAKVGAGTLDYISPASKTYTGLTDVQAGALGLDSNGTSILGNVNVGDSLPVAEVLSLSLNGFIPGDTYQAHARHHSEPGPGRRYDRQHSVSGHCRRRGRDPGCLEPHSQQCPRHAGERRQRDSNRHGR